MSEHLPECPKYDGGVILCICDRLRQAEQRVRDDLYTDAEVEEYNQKHYDKGRREGYDAGVTAARDAVAAVPEWAESSDQATTVACDKADALAAIDALKGERQ